MSEGSSSGSSSGGGSSSSGSSGTPSSSGSPAGGSAPGGGGIPGGGAPSGSPAPMPGKKPSSADLVNGKGAGGSPAAANPWKKAGGTQPAGKPPASSGPAKPKKPDAASPKGDKGKDPAAGDKNKSADDKSAGLDKGGDDAKKKSADHMPKGGRVGHIADGASQKGSGQRIADAAQTGSGTEVAKRAAEEGVAKGVGAVSGTGQVGEAATRVVLRTVAAGLGVLGPVFIMVFVIIIAAGFGGSTNWDGSYATAAPVSQRSLSWLPLETTRDYQRSVMPYNYGGSDSIPWGLVAAAGTLASENGRISADGCDRRPGDEPLFAPQNLDDEDCSGVDWPVSEPEIESSTGGGAGPFLINASAVEASGLDPDDVDLQDLRGSASGGAPSSSSEFVAYELNRIKTDMIFLEGWEEPQEGAEDEAVAFWTEAVTRLPVVSPAGGRCSVPVATMGDLGVMGPPTIPIEVFTARFEEGMSGRTHRLPDDVPFDRLVEMYYDEGIKEGVRADWAISQAILETGWFDNPDSDINNFAGIGHCDDCSQGFAFDSPERGVRAHIQLLRKAAQGNDVELAQTSVVGAWAGVPQRQWNQLAGCEGCWASPETDATNYWASMSGIFRQMGGIVPPDVQADDNPAAGGPPTPSTDAVNTTPNLASGSDPSAIGKAIALTWNCELGKVASDLYTLNDVIKQDDDYISLVSGNRAVSIITSEALMAAWAWSGWGERNADAAFCAVTPPDQPAGVFPLTEDVFSAFASDPETQSRCDAGPNIVAAVRAFIAGETVEPGKREGSTRAIGDRSEDTGKFNPMIGGWWAMPWVLGSEDNLDRFLSDGGRDSFLPDSGCQEAILSSVETLASNPAFADVFGSSGGAASPELIAAVADADPRTDGDCGADVGPFGAFEMAAASIAASRYETQRSEALARLAEIDEGQNPEEDEEFVALESYAQSLGGVAAVLRQIAASSAQDENDELSPGEDPVLTRFADRTIVLEGYMPPSDVNPNTFARNTVRLARLLSGIVPFDSEFDPFIDDEELTKIAAELRKEIFGSQSSGVSSLEGMPDVIVSAINAVLERIGEHAPGCEVDFALMAAVAYVESASFWGQIGADGVANPPIIGPVLDGSGVGGNTTPILDTDQGKWDGNTVYDAAVGPFQFIPSTWVLWESDGDGDGIADPQNVYDQALAALRYLCSLGNNGNLLEDGVGREALARYGGGTSPAAFAYADKVLERASYYRTLLANSGGAPPLGSIPGGGQFIWPTSGVYTSPFGMRDGVMHEGIDVADGLNTPIYASAGGRVIFAGVMGGYGNTVDIDHGGGLTSRYAHMSSFVVSVNQVVEQGQNIGFQGFTGDVRPPGPGGTHIHFEIRINGAARNPLEFLPGPHPVVRQRVPFVGGNP